MIRRTAVLLMCIALFLLCLQPSAAPAESAENVIRVGWYETPFNHKDAFGRRTGYAYEYQRKIAAYTGWKYQYIEGNWSELLKMLQEGSIDMMSDVSFTEERAQQILYSSIPMGSELYYLFVSPDCTDILTDDPATLNGKKVGITANTVQTGLFRQWAEARGVSPELVMQDCSEEESLKALKSGLLDAFVTLDSYGDPETAVPLWKIGSSDFFFAVSKGRPDLLSELDAALNRIQDENKLYSEQLSAKYLHNSGTNRFLSAEEKEWLDAHGKIRIGYQDGYLAFCAADPKTGELTGALKDYLEYASAALENAHPEFEAVAFPTASAAMEALQNGEVDCMFPANLTDHDGEQAGVVLSQPLMRTAMEAVIRAEDRQNFLRGSRIRVGVNQGNPNYEIFLMDHFPSWTPVYYTDTPACLDAVAARQADCIIISNYRFHDISGQCKKLNLTTVHTGVDMDYCLAVREGSTVLYSILSRLISQVPESTVNAALTYYSSDPPQTGLTDLISEHPLATALAALSIVFFLVILILLRLLSQQKKPR